MVEKNTNNLTGFEAAVIGMAGRFPGANNIDEFWNNLKNGIESIAFFSDEELEESGADSEILNNPDYVKSKAVLEDIEFYDAPFFGYSPGEAEIMEPQVRIFMECIWHTLEDAGYDPGAYDGLIGLYAGATDNMLWQSAVFFSGSSGVSETFSSGNLANKDFLSTRISYRFNLKGPSSTVFNACSTSLVALHLAYQGLLSGECDIALAGGISITLPGRVGYEYQEGMVNSSDGHIRSFDEQANGTVFGNGVAAVALKRLKDAITDGDTIYAAIKGSGINNDGNRKVGYSAPSTKGQAEVIKAALQMAEIEPESIGYIEAHGTGTTIGDPIEIDALRQAFNTNKKNFCKIGTVKTNVGHLDAASGITGFIKTVLALKHKIIPASLHFENPNPKIDFKMTPFSVNTGLTEWKCDQYPLRAGVSSFGIGGTNVHVILEECPERPPSGPSREYQLICLSARTESSLDRITLNLVDYFKKNPGINLADAAYSLQMGRRAFKKRRMLVCSSIDEVIDGLGNHDSGGMQTYDASEEKKHVVFMFSGQGPQYVNMGLDIYLAEPSFRADVDHCLEIFKSIFGCDVKHILFPGQSDTNKNKEEIPSQENMAKGEKKNKIDEVIYSGPIKFILDYSLARLLMKWGIQPHAMIGHSFGEYVAACLSGVFSIEDALQVVVWRGQLMKKTPEGVMMSVPLSENQLKPLLNEELSLAAVNTSSLCIVSGTFAAADILENQLSEQGNECVRVNFPHASHSKMMEPILEEFQTKISQLKRNKPCIPYISNVTGKWITAEQAVDPAYYATHMRQTVQFANGITGLLKTPNTAFVQVGPGRGLTLFVDQHPDKTQENLVIHLLRHSREEISDIYFLQSKIGQLWASGVNIDWSAFYANEKRCRIPLPPYSFDRHRYWKYVDKYLNNKGEIPGKAKLEKKKDTADWFYVPSWKRSMLPPQHTGDISVQPCWLVFKDACGLGHKLRKRMEQEGEDVITVRIGSSFGKVNDREFTVNPAEARDYESLLSHLHESKKIPHKVVHLWSVTPIENRGMKPDAAGVANALNLGFFSLLHLTKAIGKQDISNELQIFAITNNMQEVTGEEKLCPEKATLLGPVMVISQEFPNITCRSIDIIFPGPGSLLKQEDRMLEQLLEEFHTNSSNPMIAYRGSYRWEQVYKQVRLEKNPKTAPRLRKDGVYLITGGLGGIGLILAKHFAETVKAKLILTGRSALPPRKQWKQWLSIHEKDDKISRKIGKVLELEKLGADVLVMQADSGNLKQMQDVMNTIDERFGRLNGVIHAAGIIDDRTFQVIKSMNADECNRQFQAKVYGLLILERMLQDRELDFCSLTSSISSVLGGLGYVAYSAANIFMDAYVHKHNRISKIRWTSVNWDAWQYGEQKVMTATVGATLAKLAMTPEQGIEAFLRIIAWPEASQVVHSTGDLQTRIDQWVKRESLEELETPEAEESPLSGKRPDLSTQYISPATELEQRLLEVWKSLFGFQQIGRDDDFFELGGDSLKAMIVASMIHKKLNVKVSVTNIFTTPTIKGLAEYLNSNAQKSKYSSIEPAEEKDYYPLSPAQKRLYILQLMEKENTGYNETIVTRLEGELEQKRMEKIFWKLIERHYLLRTSFEILDGEPVQRIHHKAEFEIAYYEVGKNNPDEVEQVGSSLEMEEIIRNFVRPFDLSQAPLMRVLVIKSGSSQHIVVVDMHHIVKDGTSQEIFVKEFMALYEGEALPLPRIQYKDYSLWQNSEKRKKEIKKQEEYWLKQFETEIPVINLPCDYPRPAAQSFEGNSFPFLLEKEKTVVLKKMAKEEDVTLYMVLLSIYNILLSKLSGQEDIVVGTPIAGRGHPDVKGLMGMFVNTLALRYYPKGGKTFNTFLKEVKKRTLEAFENQDYQFEDLVEKTVVNRDVSRNPIFDVMFVMLNMFVPLGDIPEVEIPGLVLRPYDYKKRTSKFDISFFATEAGEELNFAIEYVTGLFKEKTIRKFIVYFKQIVSAVIEDSMKKISEIEIIPGEEKHQILYDFNNTAAEYPKHKTIHQLFEEQVERIPGKIALVGSKQLAIAREKRTGESVQLTYKQLNAASNRLARRLRYKGIQPNNLVGIMVERSIEMIVGIFAILKAGAVYLPIDPGYPEKRVTIMLEDSSVNILLSRDIFTRTLGRTYDVIDLTDSHSIEERSDNLEPVNVPLDPAYVIYTSGSTGRPKGVIIEHHSLVNRLNWMQKKYPLTDSDRILQKTPYTFDVSVWELFWWAIQGIPVCLLVAGGEKDPAAIVDAIEKNNITVMHFVPSMLNSFLEYVGKEGICARLKALKQVFVSGEALKVIHLERFNNLLSSQNKTRIANLYGPTEATVDVTYFDCQQRNTREDIPIGKPIDNIRLYILGLHRRLAPVRIPGELCIAGTGLARGYLNNLELTMEKFIDNPYLPGERIYKTGDLVRWLPDGNIQFLGRIDQQVKIRGFRIELGDIETQLLKHKDIKETVVSVGELARGAVGETHGGDTYLCAYFISDAELTVSQLREFLSHRLPDYMIPSHFVQMGKIPLTPNGKVNGKELPRPLSGDSRPKLAATYVAPQTDKEKIIAEVLRDILQLNEVGIYDNFFELGINSLDIIRVNQELKELFKKEIPVMAMFRYTTIHSFAQYLSREEGDGKLSDNQMEQAEAEVLHQSKNMMQQTMQRLGKV